MRFSTNCVLLLVIFMMGGASVFAHRAGSDERVQFVRMDNGDVYPQFIRFKPGQGPSITTFYPVVKELLGLEDDTQLRLVKTEKDALGMQHMTFQQIYRSYPVAFGVYKAHFKNGLLHSVNGELFDIQNQSQPSLTEQQALVNALTQYPSQRYLWEDRGEVEAIAYALQDPNFSPFPQGKIMWFAHPFDAEVEPRLAYRFVIHSLQPLFKKEIFIDAVTGASLFEQDLIQTIDVQGTAQTFYSGTQTIVTDSSSNGFVLREAGRASGVETYNMQNGSDYNQAVDFLDLDNFWNNINPANDQAATDGHWGAEMTHDYFLLKHGRSSFDGQGSKLLSYIHFDVNYSNAFWDGTRMTYGSGNNNSRPFCSLDVVGHEFAHGVTGTSAGLIYAYESGALNESFSDVFGTAIEFYSRPNNANWTIGEDLGGFRSMSSPNTFFNPDTYLGDNWATGSFDNGGVHTNSGVQNFWFYLLSMGASGTNDNNDPYSVTGLGIDTAAMIAYRNLSVYLTPSSNYADARFYAIESAADLFGFCSFEMIQTTHAWHAVGVGSAFTGTLAANFYTPDSFSCAAPRVATFQNLSNSGFYYHWDFGDGDTSNAFSPTHTYQAVGSYTVTLIAHGCNGSTDTIVMPNAVVIDPNQPCVYEMPSELQTVVAEGCEGNLYDSGGNQNYLNQSMGTFTIRVPAGNTIALTFQNFNYRAGDYIQIYDGDSINDPLIGLFAGNTLPPVIYSTGNELTIRERTNSANTAAGFYATWSCAVSNSPQIQTRWELYPNPSQGVVTLLSKAGTVAERIEVYDMQGRVVFVESRPASRFSLDLQALSTGTYVLRVRGEGFDERQKLVLTAH